MQFEQRDGFASIRVSEYRYAHPIRQFHALTPMVTVSLQCLTGAPAAAACNL
jgi:hypothetical protein